MWVVIVALLPNLDGNIVPNPRPELEKVGLAFFGEMGAGTSYSLLDCPLAAAMAVGLYTPPLQDTLETSPRGAGTSSSIVGALATTDRKDAHPTSLVLGMLWDRARLSASIVDGSSKMSFLPLISAAIAAFLTASSLLPTLVRIVSILAMSSMSFASLLGSELASMLFCSTPAPTPFCTTQFNSVHSLDLFEKVCIGGHKRAATGRELPDRTGTKVTQIRPRNGPSI